MVLFLAAAIVGAFVATEMLVGQIAQPSKETVLAQVQAGMAQSQMPPAIQAVAESYALNIVSMIYELEQLPPRAGDWAEPVANVLDWIGMTLSTPFQFGYIGWILLGGLLFGTAAGWLGGRNDLNKMLGLTALAAAPQAFNAIPILLSTLAILTGITALTGLNGLFGLIIALWSVVIYVKATAIAQNFSIGRAVGAIAIGLVILVALMLILVLVAAFMLVWFISALR